MEIDWWKWIALVVFGVACWYIDARWKGHSLATANTPERRTLYDFLQTNPRVFSALWFGAAALYTFARYAEK